MPHSQIHTASRPFVPDFVIDLIIMDRQTGQPRVSLDDDVAARNWLTEILLDVVAREAHVEKLKVGYGGKLRMPRQQRGQPSGERILPDPACGFQWFDLLPEEKVRLVLDHGATATALDGQELARLLLNPFGLYDLAERIDAELPPWWLHEMDARGKAWLAERDIHLRLPAIEAASALPVAGQQMKLSDMLSEAGLMQCRVGLKSPGSNCWELTFGEDAEAVALRRAYAENLYGDAEQPFALMLFAHRAEEENARVSFSLEVAPAPTQKATAVQLEFPGGEVRSFRLETPETLPGVDAPESFRSARCAPVPSNAVTFTTIAWGCRPEDLHVLRGDYLRKGMGAGWLMAKSATSPRDYSWLVLHSWIQAGDCVIMDRWPVNSHW